MQTSPPALIDLDPTDAEFIQNPYPYYKTLREREPVFWSPSRNWWILTRYGDVQLSYRDSRLSDRYEPRLHQILNMAPAKLHCPVSGLLDRLQLSQGSWLPGLNPPKHTHMRRLFNEGFTPTRIQKLRGYIEELCNSLIDKAIQRGHFELISDYAFPIPFTVIAKLIGLPTEDLPMISQWCKDSIPISDLAAKPEDRKQAEQVMETFTEYLIPFIKQRRKDPKDDFLSDMVATDPKGFRLTDRQAAANGAMFTSAGFETTVGLLGNGMLALLRNEEQLRLLRDSPSLIDSAVEELLRFDSPVQFHIKTVSEQLQLGGKTLKPGEQILTLIGSANRDPDTFEEPDKLDIQRKNNKHLSFGSGIHYCIGANLSRLEAQIGINLLVQRLPNLRLSSEKIVYKTHFKPRSLEALPVVF